MRLIRYFKWRLNGCSVPAAVSLSSSSDRGDKCVFIATLIVLVWLLADSIAGLLP